MEITGYNDNVSLQRSDNSVSSWVDNSVDNIDVEKEELLFGDIPIYHSCDKTVWNNCNLTLNSLVRKSDGFWTSEKVSRVSRERKVQGNKLFFTMTKKRVWKAYIRLESIDEILKHRKYHSENVRFVHKDCDGSIIYYIPRNVHFWDEHIIPFVCVIIWKDDFMVFDESNLYNFSKLICEAYKCLRAKIRVGKFDVFKEPKL